MANPYESGTNRDGWEFEYVAAKVAEAAIRQREYRQSRVQAWTEKKDEVMEKIKSSGLSIHESVSEKFSNYTRNAGGAQVMVDSTLQKDLDECMEKIREHRDLVTQYTAWVQVLEANPHARLKLKHADWMFFFGK